VKVAVPELFRRELSGRFPPGVEVSWYHGLDDLPNAVEGADVLVIGFIDAAEIRAAIATAAGVRWVSSHAAGVDHYPFDLLREHNQLLTKGSGINAPPIAEFVVLCVLSAAKTFPYFLECSNRHEWPSQRPPAQELEGSRALVVGYGEIGQAVAQRLRGLGVCVTGARRQPSDDPDVWGPDEWRVRLGDFDWVVVTAAHTPETHHLFGMHEFTRMQPTAWFFNVSRGGLVDHDALAKSLQAGQPRGAYLDVTEPEPLPAEHQLRGLPNVFITGHSAGRSPRSHARHSALLLDNFERFRTGQPLRNVVDMAAGY
jgi:phosphoglycerate dehydrogenase-like enzyme